MAHGNSVNSNLDALGTQLCRDIVYTTISEFCKMLQEHNVASDATLKELSSTFLAYQAEHGMRIKSAVTVSRSKKVITNPSMNVTAQLLQSAKSRGYNSHTWHTHPNDAEYEYTDDITFPSTSRIPIAQNRIIVGAGDDQGELYELTLPERQDAIDMGFSV